MLQAIQCRDRTSRIKQLQKKESTRETERSQNKTA
jgi:hypothetical protein